jgi:uncharacterized protein YbjT (DUF2867 family)
MKVFVVGANGQIGQHLIRLLRESDEHTVRAMVRKKEQAEFFENLGADKTLLVDLDGTVKTMEAAEKIGTKRFIMVSAIQAHRRENWNDKIKHYYVAKHYADKILEQSDLTYTIIRPGWLLNEPGTGKVSVAENLNGGSIPREDVAKTFLASLNEIYYRTC